MSSQGLPLACLWPASGSFSPWRDPVLGVGEGYREGLKRADFIYLTLSLIFLSFLNRANLVPAII